MKLTNLIKYGLPATIVCSAIGSAQAQDQGDWEVLLGAGAIYAPKYEGSDDYETGALPMLEIIWRDAISFGPEGLSANLITRENLRLYSALGYGGGRDESDSVDLTGLGDIDDGATLSFGMEYEWGPVSPYVELTKYFDGAEGLTAEFGVQTMIPIRALTGSIDFNDISDHASPTEIGPMLTAGLSTTWADDNYTQGFFGVTTAQATRSGLAQYNAQSGIKSVDLELGIIIPLSDRWSFNGIASYSQLVGDVANSPIVKDKDQFSVGAFVGFRF